MRISVLMLLLLSSLSHVHSFVAHQTQTVERKDVIKNSLSAQSRRESFQHLLKSGFAAIGGMNTLVSNQVASASGGATAGGAYLISAKQRYNSRVRDGIKQFVLLSNDLEKGDIQSTQFFFTSEAIGFWKDTSVAGYLLANAFRTSSSKPPDSLPSVKKWKAFAVEVEKMEKFATKNDVKNLLSSYNKARSLLDAYLEAVELPISAEI